MYFYSSFTYKNYKKKKKKKKKRPLLGFPTWCQIIPWILNFSDKVVVSSININLGSVFYFYYLYDV